MLQLRRSIISKYKKKKKRKPNISSGDESEEIEIICNKEVVLAEVHSVCVHTCGI